MKIHTTDTKNFISNEFKDLSFGDKRLDRKAIEVAEVINSNPALSIPAMTNAHLAQLKSLYRFFQNKKVTEEKILQTHYKNTVDRMTSYSGKILLANDTCFVTPAKKMEGLLTRGKGKDNCIRTHYCLAMSEDGKQIFGILDFHALRDPISKKYPELQDESDIWIKTAENCINNILSSFEGENLLSRCLFVADREADEFELMEFLLKNNLGFVIRSQYNRGVESDKDKGNLNEILIKSKLHDKSYQISTRKNNKLIDVKVQRSIKENILIKPPEKHKKTSSPLNLNMVVVKEVEKVEKPVCWKLWTTENISTNLKSDLVVQYYGHRWKIEEVNKGAKTGVKIEKRQFINLDHYIPFVCMAFVIGWRLVAVRTISEVDPNIPLNTSFTQEEIKYIEAESKEMKMSVKNIEDALIFIGKLGGFTGSYESPGWQILWQGWIKFYERVQGFNLAVKIFSG